MLVVLVLVLLMLLFCLMSLPLVRFVPVHIHAHIGYVWATEHSLVCVLVCVYALFLSVFYVFFYPHTGADTRTDTHTYTHIHGRAYTYARTNKPNIRTTRRWLRAVCEPYACICAAHTDRKKNITIRARYNSNFKMAALVDDEQYTSAESVHCRGSPTFRLYWKGKNCFC